MRKTIVVLGASGFVGSQVLDVLDKRDDYELIGFSVWENIDFARKIIARFSSVKWVCVKDSFDKQTLKKEYPHILFFSGEKGLNKLITKSNADVYENSIVGFAGLYPTLTILKLNKILLLSNKESLVIAGDYVNSLLDSGHGKLYPIDSEHVAISKCLYNKNISDVDYIVLTASGGCFFNYSREELTKVKVNNALENPNWSMGKKISVDSNTMTNKTFEIIEAHHLFKLPVDQIHIIANRNSYVHSYVVFKNGEVRLNVGKPTMLVPIKYALDFGKCDTDKEIFSDVEINTNDKYIFEEILSSRFPIINEASKVVNIGSEAGCVINAADEEIVSAFLDNRIEFKDIDISLIKILSTYKFSKKFNLKNICKVDKKTRKITQKVLKELRREL